MARRFDDLGDGERLAGDGPGAWKSANFAFIACTNAGALADRLAEALGVAPLRLDNRAFPDGGRYVRVPDEVEGRDVVILAPTGAPIGESLLELRLIADACWHGGADTLIGVIPYFGCARQDRRDHRGEALGVRVAADIVAGARFARLLLVDLHAPASEACFACPVDHISAVELLAAALKGHVVEPSVVVAPDFGAVKLARRYGRLLGLPVAVTEKTRITERDVATGEVLGDVEGRCPIIVDDIVSTGATIAGSLTALSARGCAGPAMVVATHGVFVPGAVARLVSLGVRRIVTTDSLPESNEVAAPIERISLAPIIAAAISRRVPAGAVRTHLQRKA
jgi:ribose-phosphate pyrophosphokinase